jgi:acetyltransferase EpsM
MRDNQNEMPIIVIGCGGHGRVIADIIRALALPFDGFLDDDMTRAPRPYSVRGPIAAQIDALINERRFVVGIGNGPTRRALSERILSKGGALATLIHPSAVIAPDVEIGAGTVIMAGALINTGSKIGRFSVVNTGAILDHDNLIMDNVHISPRVAQAGSVVIEDDVFIGTGASLIPRVRVGRGAYVAAGAVVTKDVPADSMVAGCPAVVKKLLHRD